MSSSMVDFNFDVMQCVQLLSTLSLEEQSFLQHRMEFHDYVRSASRLSILVRDIRKHQAESHISNGCGTSSHDINNLSNSHTSNFLQQDAVDDIVLRIFDFLDTQSLVQASECCSRFHDLVTRNAIQRTRCFAKERQLETPLELLRAMEEVQGIATNHHHHHHRHHHNGSSSNDDNSSTTSLSTHHLSNRRRSASNGVRHVRVPILLPHRRICITNSGDSDYNGIYYCTGFNGNGFVFTKPRFPEQRVPKRQVASTTMNTSHSNTVGMAATSATAATQIEQDIASVDSDIDMTEGRLLRCVIAKRFSNETILWYMSKEIIGIEEGSIGHEIEDDVDDEDDEDDEDAMAHERTTDTNTNIVSQVFSFWARLMVIGDAPSDICRYPSQSSILARGHPGDGWQSLSTTINLHPPIVELLD